MRPRRALIVRVPLTWCHRAAAVRWGQRIRVTAALGLTITVSAVIVDASECSAATHILPGCFPP